MLFLESLLIIFGLFKTTPGAVLPPPWANPKVNPCATQPNGWQLLYWPPDDKCYRIFKIGYPCPDDMELSPSPTKAGEQKFSAECRCPPTKAQSARDGKCYELYSKGPCDKGYYFAPDTKYNSNNPKRLWGICVQSKTCPHSNEIFWPRDGKCYSKLSKGPCPKGQLIYLTPDKLAECRCTKQRELRDYRYNDGNCYQHFTRGPCREKGHLFLPDRTCGCHSFLPHFHDETELCFEIGSIEPCSTGRHYQLHPETRRGTCQCKPGYIPYTNTTQCYRPFTQGPCPADHILVNSTTCIRQPCTRGYLYFPRTENECYRIGTRGPCPRGRLVTFDFDTRPSIDGISYNGVCSCQKHVYDNLCDNQDLDEEEIECDRAQGMISYRKRCYKLYTQGPCPKGAWIAPKRRHKKQQQQQQQQDIWTDSVDSDYSSSDVVEQDDSSDEGVCECVPGYTKTVRTLRYDRQLDVNCMAPTVILANYLNRNFSTAADLLGP